MAVNGIFPIMMMLLITNKTLDDSKGVINYFIQLGSL